MYVVFNPSCTDLFKINEKYVDKKKMRDILEFVGNISKKTHIKKLSRPKTSEFTNRETLDICLVYLGHNMLVYSNEKAQTIGFTLLHLIEKSGKR